MIFVKPERSVIERGTSATNLFSSANKSRKPDEPMRVEGKVSAVTAGRKVCKEKYIGNSPFWRVANCGRSRVLNATDPPINVYFWNKQAPFQHRHRYEPGKLGHREECHNYQRA
jgi:hypothetical protein